jgi:dephospho-CoA kinase
MEHSQMGDRVMKLIGITGGVGMGKSTAGRLLEELGIPVMDTDVVARQVVERGQPALEAIRYSFGTEMIGEDGGLRREALAARVFSEDDAARQKLESILHPRIRAVWRAQAESWRQQDRPVAAVVIPLLFETKAESECDATFCVACTSVTQRRRLAPRRWTDAQIAQRIAAQWPIEKKMLLADHVVWTEGDLKVHLEQLRRLLFIYSS